MHAAVAAAAIAVKGLYNPVDWGRAAELFAIGSAEIALGSALSGGGGGGGRGSGGGGLSSASFAAQQNDVQNSRGSGTIQIVGSPFLNMNDPAQRDALAGALQDLFGLRVIFTGPTR